MSLSCGCDCGDEFVELDPDYMSRAPNTIICRECRTLIKPGSDYYRVRLWSFDEWGEEIDTGVREVCEACGDLAYTILNLGYCYGFGTLRNDVREMAAIAEENRLSHEAWKKRKQEQTNGTK